ncbi:Histidine--tRNA ligase chloroplastic/mitochondrial, partial [Bienertia sinuspersici]
MAANPSRLIFHPTLNVYFKTPNFKTLKFLPLSLLNPRRSHSFPIATTCFSSLSSSSSSCSSPIEANLNVSPNSSPGNGGRSGALSPSSVIEAPQKIDVNPPKGTRDFPPEEMRLRSWLFQNFREVSHLFGFEEVDFPVLESEALFIRKAGEEIKDQ